MSIHYNLPTLHYYLQPGPCTTVQDILPQAILLSLGGSDGSARVRMGWVTTVTVLQYYCAGQEYCHVCQAPPGVSGQGGTQDGDGQINCSEDIY